MIGVERIAFWIHPSLCEPRRFPGPRSAARTGRARTFAILTLGAVAALPLASCSSRSSGPAEGSSLRNAAAFDVTCPPGSRVVVQHRENLPPLLSCADSASRAPHDRRR